MFSFGLIADEGGRGGRAWMRILSYVKVALFTTVNILLNGATLGRYVWLRGRVERGVFTN
jgi:hypothetical protein